MVIFDWSSSVDTSNAKKVFNLRKCCIHLSIKVLHQNMNDSLNVGYFLGSSYVLVMRSFA